jgi:putative MATE family efflux protein
VILTVVGVLLSEPLLRLMGNPEDVLPFAAKYMRIYFCGITFTMVYNFCASILRAAGDTRSPLIFLTLAGVINVGMNVLFVTQMGMDVDGVALATVISQGVAALLVVIAMIRRKDDSHLDLRKLRIYKYELLKIVRIGLPAGLQSSMFSISNVMIQSSVNSFGSVVMSGNAASGNIEGFIWAAMNAFHQTAVNFTGQNMGARRYDRIRMILWCCLGSVTVVGLALGALAYGFGPRLLSIYITDSPEAIEYGLLRMAYMCLPYFLCGLMDVSSGSLRGLGSSFTPMVISVLGICGIRIAWIYTVFQIPRFHTIDVLFASYPISWAITYAAQLFAFLTIFNKFRREHGLLPQKAK